MQRPGVVQALSNGRDVISGLGDDAGRAGLAVEGGMLIRIVGRTALNRLPLGSAIAGRLGVPCGTYTHIALVPHVYYRRDINDIEPFCKSGTEIRPVAEVCRACGKCSRASGA